MFPSIKPILYLILFCAYNASLFSQSYLQWQEGEYSSYHTEWKEGDWENLSFHAIKKQDAELWNLDVVYRSKNRDALLKFQVPVPSEKNEISANSVGAKVLRGKEMQDAELKTLTSRIFDLLSLKYFPWQRTNPTTLKETFCCGLNSAKEFEEIKKEESFFHAIHPSVPLLGLVKSKSANGSYITYLTSFGKKDSKESVAKTMYPTFIDFGHLKEVSYKNFSIAAPSSWLLSPMPSMEPNTDIWISKLGGNAHSAQLILKIKTDKPDSIQNLHSRSLSEKGAESNFIHKDLNYETTLSEDSRLTLFQFDLKKKGKIGKQFISYVTNEDKTKLAEIVFFIDFEEKNPNRSELPKILSQGKEILKTFRFVSSAAKD